jgi:hypothetical protein
MNRTKLIQIKVTPLEKEKVNKIAESKSQTLSDYVRTKILNVRKEK